MNPFNRLMSNKLTGGNPGNEQPPKNGEFADGIRARYATVERAVQNVRNERHMNGGDPAEQAPAEPTYAVPAQPVRQPAGEQFQPAVTYPAARAAEVPTNRASEVRYNDPEAVQTDALAQAKAQVAAAYAGTDREDYGLAA
ncbi:MAG TPA: hypothetical protein VF261_02545 [Candidatus Saccharimonadales bacterium]